MEYRDRINLAESGAHGAARAITLLTNGMFLDHA